MAMDYLSFREDALKGFLAEDPAPFLDELELQASFFAGYFGRNFISHDGRRIEIVQFGEWNHGAGPDFLHCAIRVDDQLLSGPIEIDLHPSDWETHGHSLNEDFDEVILHLSVHTPKRETYIRNTHHRQILQAIIPPDRLDTILPPPLYQAPVSLGRCFHPLGQISLARVEDLLKKAALYRAKEKAQRFHALVETHGYSQALWQHLAAALGYHRNQLPMILLAQRAPINKLRQLSQLDRTAYLFGLSGFLRPDLPEQAPQDSHQYLRDLWSSWWKNRPHPEPRKLPWRFNGIRPANHPQRRVVALANLLSSWSSLEKLSQASSKEFSQKLQETSDEFWNFHYTLTSKARSKPIALFGKQRAQDILANLLHPLRLSLDAERAWPSYAKLRAPSPSEKVKRAAYRLFGERPECAGLLSKAWQQQGLLQIYQDFCLRDTSDCEQCPFPEQLAKW